ncbi:MAG TPA: hypothetical protein DIT64_19075 [Verrucomicrobiales bacterium]|nr:hypothetical protein [Verrucomicrobiales bacterium]
MVEVTLIAAVSADGFISCGRGIPWDLPEDKKHFRAYAEKKWLLLGRVTHSEMSGWFRDHQPLVMTRDAGCKVTPGQCVASVEEALHLAESADQPELLVCGGSQIYAEAMPFADKLVITHVDRILGAGLPFPKIHRQSWEPVSRIIHGTDALHDISFEIITWRRVAALPGAGWTVGEAA